jgi:hypothetical protein
MFLTATRDNDAVTSFSSKGPTRGRQDFNPAKYWSDNMLKPDLVAQGNRVSSLRWRAAAARAHRLEPAGQGRCSPCRRRLSQGRGQHADRSGADVAAAAPPWRHRWPVGAIALMLEANPGLTPPLIKAILQYAATPTAADNLLQQGAGELNVQGALALARVLRPGHPGRCRSCAPVDPGDSLLATNATLPAPQVALIDGQTSSWTRMAMVGGTHLVRGDALSTGVPAGLGPPG